MRRPLGRLRSSIFAALVLLSLAPPAARAEEPSPAAPAAQTAQAAPAAGVSIVDAWLDQAALRWRKHEELLARGDREGAMAAADEAAVFLRDEGIGRCPALADAALAEARRATDPKAAIEAAVLARRFDPENGAASWLEARSRWRASGSSSAISAENFFNSSSGSCGTAEATRFCTSTWAMSRSVPTLKVMTSLKVPSLALEDCM